MSRPLRIPREVALGYLLSVIHAQAYSDEYTTAEAALVEMGCEALRALGVTDEEIAKVPVYG